MNCDELREEYEFYALGMAPEDAAAAERAELRQHLERGCPDCLAGVHSALRVTTLLAGTAPAVVPSSALRRRILASVGVERRSWGWTPLWIAATAFSLVVAFYFYGRDRDNAIQMAKFQAQAREQAIQLARSNEALAILNQPDTIQAVFGQSEPPKPRGRVFVNAKTGVLLLASNLPPAPAGKAYEMWVIPKTGPPAPAGVFQAGTEGTAVHVQPTPVEVGSTKAVAVTLEPAAGSPQPTSTPVIVAALAE